MRRFDFCQLSQCFHEGSRGAKSGNAEKRVATFACFGMEENAGSWRLVCIVMSRRQAKLPVVNSETDRSLAVSQREVWKASSGASGGVGRREARRGRTVRIDDR